MKFVWIGMFIFTAVLAYVVFILAGAGSTDVTSRPSGES